MSKFKVTGADVDGGVLLRINSRFLGLLRGRFEKCFPLKNYYHGEIDGENPKKVYQVFRT